MRLGLLCLWTGWMLRSAASQPEDGGVRPGGQLQTEPEGVRTGFRSQSSGDPAGGARRRAALSGPRVCGGRCCLGWTVSPKTKRCTKPRCFPPCRNGSSCGLPNNCLCRKGFYGARCQFSSVPLPVGRPPETSSHPSSISPAAGPIGSSQKPEPAGSFQKPLNSNNSGPLKSGRLAGQAEGMKGDPGDVTLRFLNGTSSGSTGLMRADPDPERQSSDSEHVLELKLQTNRENKNPLRSESLELQASLEVKKDEDPTGAERRPEEMKRQIPSLREAQSILLRNSLSQGGRGGNMAALLMKHIRREKRKLHTLTSSSSSSSSSPTTMRAFQNQRGRVDSHLAAPKVLCPLLCKNGGVCLQTDRCLCPANFTGKFCQIPVPPPGAASTNEIVRLPLPSSAAANQELIGSEFLLPLGQNRAAPPSADPRMVKVRVQHPPEASVKIHQVMKVSGSSPALRTLSSSSSSGSAGAPAPAGGARIQAQTLRGGGTYNQQSGFKYCFREVKDGQCSSPLPGLRSREVCCRGIGKAWGLTDCSLCPEAPGQSNSSCPVGFERTNGTQCVDVNECLQPGLCENGICVNTRGSYSCVCRLGFILDATHGICISQSVISEEKGQCYRVLGSSRGPYTCSLPIVRNITKQICCCSRVGKAWGPDCVRCPFFGSVAFKEICPAGPGYHYSASTLQISQRVGGDSTGRESLLTAQGGSDLVPGSSGAGDSSSQQRPSSSGSPSGTRTGPVQSQIQVPAQPGVTAGSRPTPPAGPEVQHGQQDLQHGRQDPQHGRQDPQHGRLDPQNGRQYPQNGRLDLALARPQPPLALPSSGSQPDPAPVPADSLLTPAPPRTSELGSRPGPEPPGLERRPAASPTSRPARVQPVRGVCQIRPGVCERGRCVDLPGGKHTCECDEGFQPNAQRSRCFDVDECQQNPCSNGRCENSPGSFRCDCYHGYRLAGNTCEDVDECQQNPCSNGRCENSPGSFRCDCRRGYRFTGNTCEDVDECVDPLRCPGQECINTPGSFRCSPCQPGFGLLNGICTDIDECRQSPCSGGRCENTPGSFRCVCRHGYRLQNNTCTDVDECAEPSQCPGQMCVNSVGSYRCVSCRPGYTLTNRQCTDVDECASAGACDAEQVCVNSVGSFRCDCRPGYRSSGLGRRCTDVNECLEGDFCFSRGECVNTPGSYTCVCSPGFTLSENRTACLDVDECVSSGGSVCPSRRCENTIGSFRCLATCQPGQRVAADGSCVGPPVSAPASAAASSQPAAPRLPSSVSESGSRPESTHSSSSSSSSGSQISAVNVSPVLHHSSAAQPGELRDCYYNLAAGGCSLLAANTSQQECCCTAGEGWGWGCHAHACPAADTADFLSLCLSGRGYVTAGSGTFSYTDVDECKRFHPEVCKNGVCVNNIPGYRCYCSSGFVYSAALLECIDYDECEEESCVGGVCVNTVGSFYCSCPPPLVLDDTQRNCVNASHLTMDENLSLCWQHVSADLLCQSPLLGAQVTFIDCCCFYGEGWGMGCALCPATDSEDYASLCSSYSAAAFPGSFPDSAGPETGPGRGAAPYSPEFFPAAPLPGRDFSQDYDDYLPAGGSRSGFRARPPVSFAPPDDAYGGSEFSPGFYPEGDYGSPDGSAPRTPALQLPPDPRSDIAFMARPLPPSRPDPPPLSLAPRPGPPYDDREGGDFRGWRPGAGLPPFTDSRGGGGGGPRRVYERRYETHASLSAAEDCGILHGCENGQCIRVAEGYTCDCYAGFELDLTSMSCIDINECEDAAALPFPCVNARCVNTEGSFRCVCRRGYVMSRRRNHCIAA
ncbi:latent-transforming growth factor beta-binding protein 4 isoform X4 [Poecilia formosa]|uniref:latent-transforming growth factor beta-binding protein 4 isoform X4 n=1 Tax=Poecilia formosa TaxID=48698 RepID=UPI0007B8980F|nr:PREDICTED: latent-transforming growth factor beta-binding protein 4 isoform X4 [Poecilia formosa]